MNKIKKAYRQNQLEGVPPERITLMLFEGALGFIDGAREASLAGDGPGRGERITRTLAIIGELQATLDFETGGEIATNLMTLYDYMTRELLKANLHGDADLLSHVADVLRDVRDGWAEMVEQVAADRNKASSAPDESAARRTGSLG